MRTRLRFSTLSTLRQYVALLRGAACALVVVCTLALGAGAVTGPHAYAAAACSPTTTPTADDTPPADFSSDANIIGNFTAARQAEGCATTFTLPAGFDGLSPQQQMLALFNTERADRGLGALQLDGTLLSQISLNHSREMAQYAYFDHPSPINQPTGVFARFTVNPAIAHASHGEGENISAGQSTAASAVYGFMYQDSQSAWGHRHNILGNFDWVGIGIAPGTPTSPFTPYYTDDFLQDSPATPYTPPATANTNAPSLNAPTLAGSVATVTNVVEQGDPTAITGVVFYTGSIVETGNTFNTVAATNQGNGTWTATLPAGATGALHAIAVDASGNFTDVAIAGATAPGGGTGGTGACTPDGTVCLTSFTASSTAPAAGTSVTLTASTNIDPGPTIWFVDIVDENGAILTSCGSGLSCTATASSAGAATHQYTARLSTSSSSISAGAPTSATVAVTWSAAAGGTGGTGGTAAPGGAGACTPDGTVCLTSFTASSTTPAAGTSVTLTASTNIDPGPTIWFVDIVDENGAILTSCGSGLSCTATASSAGAATHQYTARLSSSSSSITARCRRHPPRSP